jgi:hypothetical protein
LLKNGEGGVFATGKLVVRPSVNEVVIRAGGIEGLRRSGEKSKL